MKMITSVIMFYWDGEYLKYVGDQNMTYTNLNLYHVLETCINMTTRVNPEILNISGCINMITQVRPGFSIKTCC